MNRRHLIGEPGASDLATDLAIATGKPQDAAAEPDLLKAMRAGVKDRAGVA